MKDTQLSIIMKHIYQLQVFSIAVIIVMLRHYRLGLLFKQETTGELRSDLDQRNADVSRLQEELAKMRVL